MGGILAFCIRIYLDDGRNMSIRTVDTHLQHYTVSYPSRSQFYSEDGGNVFLRNVGNHIADNTTQKPQLILPCKWWQHISSNR
jgi:hypothetical protein